MNSPLPPLSHGQTKETCPLFASLRFSLFLFGGTSFFPPPRRCFLLPSFCRMPQVPGPLTGFCRTFFPPEAAAPPYIKKFSHFLSLVFSLNFHRFLFAIVVTPWLFPSFFNPLKSTTARSPSDRRLSLKALGTPYLFPLRRTINSTLFPPFDRTIGGFSFVKFSQASRDCVSLFRVKCPFRTNVLKTFILLHSG